LVGLQFEARIAAAPGVLVVCRGAEADVARSIQQAVHAGCRKIFSFGVAAGLDPALRAGDCIIANEISDASGRYPADSLWSRKLLRVISGARTGCIAGIDAIVSDPAAKLELHRRTGAVAADMESHIVARVAADHGVGFAAIRVVLDPAHRMLPEAALAAAGANGAVDTASLARAVLARPSQLAALSRLALDAYAARRSLVKLRRLLGP
jgi:hopanoid-associated phosphorylase